MNQRFGNYKHSLQSDEQGTTKSLTPMTTMNCTHCNMELPHDAAFCSRCGNPTGNPPICPPAAPFRQQTGTGSAFFIVCACAAGALMLILMFIFVGLAFFGSQSLGGGSGVRCCNVSLPEPEWIAAHTEKRWMFRSV